MIRQLLLLSLSLSLGQSGPVSNSEFQWDVVKVNGMPISHKEYNSQFYYVSTTSTNWLSASDACKNLMGPTASLLSIETQDEWDFIKLMLEQFSTAVNYWTDGTHNPNAQPHPYAWGNDRPIGAWAPWGANQPPMFGFPMHRLAVHHTSKYTNDFRIEDDSTSQRYICEFPNPTKPLPCYVSNDLLILIDSSGSVSPAHFQIALNFTARLADAFSDTLENRIGMIRFDSSVATIFDLTVPTNPADIQTRIMATPYTAGGTRTDLAIDAAVAMFQRLGRAVPKNVVVLTDGASNEPQLTIAAAQRATAAGLKMHSVGIGMTSAPQLEELRIIAGGDLSRVFTTDNFDNLVQLLRPVSDEVCPH